MAEKKKNDQVNVDFSKWLDLLADLDSMVEEDDSDRSKFIRKLVRAEKARRQQLPLPPPFPQPTNRKRSAAQSVAA